MGRTTCPLCGALPSDHDPAANCDSNITAVVLAAKVEIAKISLLRKELEETVRELQKEAEGFGRKLPRVEVELKNLSTSVDEMLSPKLRGIRSTYSALSNKRGEVKEALSIN
jgi:chromosome segregation ATPase